MSKKNRIYDYIIAILLYIGLSCLPFNLLIENNYVVIALQIVIQVLIGIGLFFYFYKHKEHIFECNNFNKKALFILLPTFIVCFSNYFVLLSGYSVTTNIDVVKIILLIFLNIFLVFNEEIIFRYFGFSVFKDKKPILKIIFSSMIFAIAHLSRFLSTFNPFDLITIVYSFGLGLLVAIFYEFTNSLFPGIILHILFNIFNDVIFANIFSYKNQGMFIVINIIVALAVIIYIVVLYFMIKRKINIKENKNIC